MFLCLGWLIFALSELKDSDKSCWEPFTWQYLNYYVILILVLGPALTLALGIVLLICCLPCILKELIKILKDERQRANLSERVINGLAKRTFNPKQFTSQKECAICLSEFTEQDQVTTLSCDIKHYFHSACIENWIKTNVSCPLCRTQINPSDLKAFNKNLDKLLERQSQLANMSQNDDS